MSVCLTGPLRSALADHSTSSPLPAPHLDESICTSGCGGPGLGLQQHRRCRRGVVQGPACPLLPPEETQGLAAPHWEDEGQRDRAPVVFLP